MHLVCTNWIRPNWVQLNGLAKLITTCAVHSCAHDQLWLSVVVVAGSRDIARMVTPRAVSAAGTRAHLCVRVRFTDRVHLPYSCPLLDTAGCWSDLFVYW